MIFDLEYGMNVLKQFGVGSAIVILISFSSGLCFGGDPMATGIQHKFFRGVSNAITGWIEIPKQLYLGTTQGPPVLGTLQGVFEGVGMSLVRTTAGLYDVATFPIPFPWDYAPLFKPEYVWQEEGPVEEVIQFQSGQPQIPHARGN
jgi:putative exosortase-associated protein (TIGR04073 family)